jgi:peptide/nickel transport system substrate-binding protein
MVQAVLIGNPLGITSPARAATQDLYVGFLQPIDSLNPFIGTTDAAYLLYGLLYDYPFSFDQDGKFVGNLVTSASCDSSCFNWTYQIRQGVKWSDGTPYTANDFNFTINYQLPSGSSFFHLWAYEPYLNQIRTCTSGVKTACGASITSPWNVTVYFKIPFVAGHALFSIMIQQAQWSGVSPQSAQTSFTNSNPIGTGPFIADPNIYNEWTTGSPLHLMKNANYHPVGNRTSTISHIDNLYLETFSDETQLAIALEKGNIQLAHMTPAGVKLVSGSPGVSVQEGLESIQEWNEIGITQIDNNKVDSKLNPARWDRNVRRALAMATNKDHILQVIFDGKGVRGDSLMTPITPQWWYDPTTDPGANLTFDLAQANALLDAAGYNAWWTDTDGTRYRMANQTITLNVQTPACLCPTPTNVTKLVPAGQKLEFSMEGRSNFPEEVEVATYLKAQWAQVGVKIDYTPVSELALSADVYGGHVDTYVWFWSGDPDPNYLLSIQSGYTLDGWSDNYYDNVTYNRLYVQQLADLNVTQRQKDVRAAEKQEYEDAAYIIYLYPFGEWAYRSDLWTGWGDWNAHPYRQMDAFWGANPLWFDLQEINGGQQKPPPPTTPVIQGPSSVSALTNVSYTFTGTSSDAVGTIQLNWTFSWGDGTTNTTTTPSTATSFTASHVWTSPATRTVLLAVNDGYNPAVISAPVTVTVANATTSVGYLRGFVRDPSGTAVSGAFVTTTSPAVYSQGTAANGSYRMTLPVGTYDVTAGAQYHANRSVTGVQINATATTWHNFTLTFNAGWIAGTVKSSADGSVIVSAGVTATLTSGTGSAGATNVNGAFNLTVSVGTYTVTATATGFDNSSQSGVVVTGGHTTTVPFSLNPRVSPGPGLSPLLIGGIALIAVVAAAIVLVIVLRIRSKKKEEEEARVNLPPKP